MKDLANTCKSDLFRNESLFIGTLFTMENFFMTREILVKEIFLFISINILDIFFDSWLKAVKLEIYVFVSPLALFFRPMKGEFMVAIRKKSDNVYSYRNK